jgi:AmmeMemoRadiSam system protein B/AmmeMemoRadiSam system protein A
MGEIHCSPYAGTWYPGDERQLGQLVEDALHCSRARTGPELLPGAIAFVVPHAGLMYSGTVACGAYLHVQARQPRRIVLLGFSHRGGPAGVAIPDVRAFATPLGKTYVDEQAVACLRSHPQFRLVDEEQVCDHSIEIQLPLIQYTAPDAHIVPLYVGSMPIPEEVAAARALAQLADPDTLFLASSDLTHFGDAFGFQPFPADGKAAERLAELDREVMEDAGSLDADLFLAGLRHSGATVCGRAPVAMLLRTLACMEGEEIFAQMLDYQTSGELTDDFHHSVSYGVLGYFPESSFRLPPAEADELLAVTRLALARYLRDGTRGGNWPELAPALMRRVAAFVTLRERGKLRGCMGAPGNGAHLLFAVTRLVISAATEDPRFPPLMPGYSGELDVEVSLLTPMKRIRGRELYRLHEHGALVECGDCRSLLLPHISLERSWTAGQFWEALADKAKLPAGVYDDPRTRLHVFRTQTIK